MIRTIKEKKMPTIFIDYLPAELKENKDWYVSYYAKNPETGKLQRKRTKLNRIKNIKDRRRYGKKLVSEINHKLESGWNPFLEDEAPKTYFNLYKVFKTYIQVKNKELKPQSMRSYKSNLNQLIEYLERIDPEKQMYVASFSKKTATEFLNYMYIERNVAERRYNNILTFGFILFNWMKQYGYTSNNPFEGLKKKKEKNKKRKVIPADIRTKIKDYLKVENIRFFTFLQMEFYSLLRPNEILSLKISDINLKKQIIKVRPEIAKNGKFRLTTIPDVLVPYIKTLELYKYKADMYVFSDNMKPGNNLKITRYARRRWIKMQKALNLPKEYQMYSLRDGGIIHMLENGVSVDEVAKQAGHSSLSITSKYALHANTKASEQIKNKSKEF